MYISRSRLIYLFEGGILEKMTKDEYEKMFKLSEYTKNTENSNGPNNVHNKIKQNQLVIF